MDIPIPMPHEDLQTISWNIKHNLQVSLSFWYFQVGSHLGKFLDRNRNAFDKDLELR